LLTRMVFSSTISRTSKARTKASVSGFSRLKSSYARHKNGIRVQTSVVNIDDPARLNDLGDVLVVHVPEHDC
jgi:hypothetical protein